MKSQKMALSALAILITGCASVTGTLDQTLSIQTFSSNEQIQGAVCDLENDKGKWFVTTPGTVQIDRSNEDLIVLCRKEGHETGTATVVSGAGASVAGNVGMALLIPIVGIVGAIVDHNSGATYKYPTNIQIYMGQATTIQERPPKGETTASQKNRSSSASNTQTEQRFIITAEGVVPDTDK